jgi:clathrin heavy chain
MSDIPIEFTELTDLTSLGINPQSLEFRSTTLESDRYVTVREQVNGANTVAIVDLANGNTVTRKNMSADNAILHPSQFIISLRANGTTIQIFNLGTKEKLKSFNMSEPVIFWKWLNDEQLGLVTASAVYTWNVFDGNASSGPSLLTQRHANLTNSQIINFVANEKLDWFAVVGITQESGRIAGKIQLFSKQRNVSQAIEGHVAGFSSLQLDGGSSPTQVFVCGNRTATGGQLHIIEIDHDANNPPFQKKNVDIFFPPDATNDFPISVQISKKYGVVYLLTKYGFIHLYDLESGSNLFVNRITATPVFIASSYDNHNGILAINKSGQVLAVEIAKDKLVPYILNKLSNVSLALSMASRGGLPGAENLFLQQFDTLLQQGDYSNAAKVAASSEQWRTPQTIQKLKNIQAAPGTISPILQYFSTLLDKGKLNQFETIELAKPVLQQDRKQLFEKWLKEDKLTSSEELGDIVKPFDLQLALAIYLRAQTHAKVISSLAELGQFDKIVPYCEKVGFQPNFIVLISNLLRTNPDKASEFAISLLNSPSTSGQIEVEKIADIFFSQNFVQQGTSFLLDALKDDSPNQGHLQTRLLEINLLHAPQVADAILGNDMFHHYDRATIAQLSEKSGLPQRALENYSDIKDIKRVIVNTQAIPADWLVAYFGRLNVEQSMVALRELLDKNMAQNLQIVIQVATKYSDLIGSAALIKLFEEFKCYEGLYYYLASIVNLTEDKDVVFKYIQAAAKLGQFKEIERVVKDNNVYDAEKVKNFLKDADLQDQLPLIIVCDRFNYVHDLILYLYKHQFFKFIEVYVQQVNPSKTPQVVAALLDVDCDEKVIQNLIQSVIGQVPIAELTAEVEKRNRLKLLLPFLEATLNSGVQDQAVFNTLAKIYIDSNNNPEKFLKENGSYDTLEVGHYCEKRDPYLAYIAYEKGHNDDELIRITNENAMYKYQARYLLNRSDLGLWNKVLVEENVHRRQLIDQVVGTAVPEATDAEPVSLTVKAFMDNDLTAELVELLEKIILEPSPFSENPSLQGLLMVTAIKVEPTKVMSYVEKLNEFDPIEIGVLAVEANLYEEAFEIYDKNKLPSKALAVLVEDVMSLDRGETYAEKIDTPELWSQLGAAQLNGLRIPEAIESYIKANDPSNYESVIDIADSAGKYEELVKYLLVARQTLKEPKIDGELLIAYAEMGKLDEIEKFLNGSNVADLNEIGDKLYDRKDYKAAKLLYSSVSNYSKLASTLVFLDDYQSAVECARKASNVKVWKQVNDACLEHKEFRLAQICGLNLIVHAEELDEMVEKYESSGYFNELISLFEAGMGLERAHMGMFTELAILYTKYNPSKTMEHLKLFWSRINIPKVIRATEAAHLWPELIFLYAHYDEWDNAALTMIDKAAAAFDHSSFKDIIVKVANLEIYYKAINFYVNEHPSLITDLLAVLTPRLDIPRTVRIFQKSDNLPLIKPFLISVLEKNNSVVNSAYHDLLIEEEDHETLGTVVDIHDKFDSIDLAGRLEKHDLIFFRKIAARLYRKNKKWNKALSILKTDQLWKDAIETAAISHSTEVSEDLLTYFVETGNNEAFIGLLYTAYDLIRYDKVLELAWLHELGDFIKPYQITIERQRSEQLAKLMKDLKVREDADAKNNEQPTLGTERLMITNGIQGLGYHPTGQGFGNAF